MNVKDLEASGFLVPYSDMSPYTIEEVKCRFLDTILSLVGGAFAVPDEEMAELKALVREEPGARPVWHAIPETSMEMAGFVNGYLLRYADWGDTYRRACGIGVGGHPSDAQAAILALCDAVAMPGAKVIKLIHLAYQMWSALQEHMLWQRLDVDYTTTISFTTPVIAGLAFDASPERIQNALDLSGSSGMILEQVRPADITNLKSGATAYSTARGLWCYRFSDLIQAPRSMFDGKKGWYKAIAPYQGDFVMPADQDAYATLQLKLFPAFNCAQGPLDCALSLHDEVKDRIDEIVSINIMVSEGDWAWVNRPGQAKYPPDQSEADHHLPYCMACALLCGTMTPLQYREEYLQSQKVRDLIDLVHMRAFTAEEYAEAGSEESACAVEIVLKDGTKFKKALTHPAGVFTGMEPKEKVEKLRTVVERKRIMLEEATGFDLSKVAEMVYALEETDSKTLISKVREAIN